MTIRKHNPWETSSDISALMPLGTRNVSLFAHASGLSRHQGDPVVIFFTGAGAPAAGYIKVQQHISSFVRTLFYDRAGYDRSTLPSSNVESLTAQDAAKDLGALLKQIDVLPPYILVGHSYGGILLREFLHLQLKEHHPTDPTEVIAGVVLYDTGTELEYAFFPRLPSADLLAVSNDIDWEVLTKLKAESGMTDEEWSDAMEAGQRTREKVAQREDTHGSARVLAEKMQLERHIYKGGNLAVIRCNSARDYQMMYDEGVRIGGGTKEERAGARKFIHEWGMHNFPMAKVQGELVGDQGNTLHQELPHWGHDSVFRKPELVGDVVEWVLHKLDDGKKEREMGHGLSIRAGD
ncbi:hypothetical protein H2200_009036 [Cladophialophora chaetospira]|uniref:AB hydrolase-1 domain-containing protein n=1 Tax=Cladophialophora chaetospira TaxID=386627 RepID=A0AA38X3G2_9EURO|nr:hypothetical protein H2200_009036 [Cladophialophora chaetospira]